MDSIRWGILSTANIGRHQVVPAIQAAERCEVVAVASRSLEKASAFAADLGIAKSYGSYGQLLHDPDIDAVYVPLPNHMHAKWTITAAENGKHVLCEKPIALSSAEAETMAAAADAAGVVVREAFMYRFHPSWVAARKIVDEGGIGDVLAIDSWFSYFNDDVDNIRNIAEYGGGALMDIGCYSIHLSRMLAGGEPTSIKASVQRDPSLGVDTLTTAILEFGEMVATFGCSTRAEPDQRVDIYGAEGRISIEIPFNIPIDRPTRLSVIAGGNPPTEPGTKVVEFDPVDQYTLQAEAFAAAVLDGVEVPDSGADIIGNMKVIERVLAATGPSGWA
ncbi:MAG: Gfo/Idh/MocA family oxidoreductase [bacterium]|nr:Gfo/Idh/MocA family oxidoreductase [bacterium]MCP4965892.1 Gfo/Idh/MocA family oxidoreductase [bacterium]